MTQLDVLKACVALVAEPLYVAPKVVASSYVEVEYYVPSGDTNRVKQAIREAAPMAGRIQPTFKSHRHGKGHIGFRVYLAANACDECVIYPEDNASGAVGGPLQLGRGAV